MPPVVLLFIPLAAAIYLLLRRGAAPGDAPGDALAELGADMDDGAGAALVAELIPESERPAFIEGLALASAGIVTGIDRGFTQATTAARRMFTLPSSGTQYAEAITRAEEKNGIPPSLLGRVLFSESAFSQDVITGRKRGTSGELGIAQFMPATAQERGIDPLNPTQAIAGAGDYLRWLYDQTGTWRAALAAYNWGIGHVQRQGLGKAPASTVNYVAKILNDVDVSDLGA